MNQTVRPGPRTGRVTIPASKSRAHRLLICATLGTREVTMLCQGISKDIDATMKCLRAMGSEIELTGEQIHVSPIRGVPAESVRLPCGESGSTLRFLLPVVGALGLAGEFIMDGRLPERPLQPLWDLLTAHGMHLEKEGNRLRFSGRLRPGEYSIPGNISSQYVSGLLFALPVLSGDSTLDVTDRIESADYIAMTEDALALFGVPTGKNQYHYAISARGYEKEKAPFERALRVESDWSSASFFLTLGALNPAGITVAEMNLASGQGDRQILELLRGFGARVETVGEDTIQVSRQALHGQRIDATAIPDLVPILAVAASVAEGETIIEHAERLRLKESDRLLAVSDTLSALGADIQETADGLRIQGRPMLRGGEVSSYNDHRIAMSAAIAATVCQEPVIIQGAECTEKSFPGFWDLLNSLEE